MLVLLLILQLLPQPAKQAVAEAMRNRYSWQQTHEQLPETWSVFTRIEYRRPTFELLQNQPLDFQPTDPRVGTINWDLSRASTLPTTTFTSGFGDASLPGGRMLGDLIGQPLATIAAPVARSTPAAIEASSAPLTLPPITGNLATIVSTRQVTIGEVQTPTDPGAEPPGGVGGGAGGGIGGGVGSPVPEPSGILMPLGTLALIVSRRSRRQNSAK